MTTSIHKHLRAARVLLPLLGIAASGALGLVAYTGLTITRTFADLIQKNEKLREAISNLTDQRQVGYARVLEQVERDGQLYTRLLFVVTDDNDPTRRLLEREYEIEGNVVHFDALIVKFSDEIVMEGEERALFLWRRIYGETMPPEEAYPIEVPGEAPARYNEITESLTLRDQELFWDEVWTLAHDPEALRGTGVEAIYGSAVYSQLRPGIIYIFNLDADGTFYPERTGVMSRMDKVKQERWS